MLNPASRRQIPEHDWEIHFQRCQGLVFVDSLPQDEGMGGSLPEGEDTGGSLLGDEAMGGSLPEGENMWGSLPGD